ncbi:hypothetical protein L484_020360 [Morus notabilis]|uniref:Uncharacterized protein n=1 Tax=Morus notabilis TaxID=981085 RepID=W9RF56_9ROSA|nr:hypothetical protein L484_020360 [Morus notabilis]
MVMEVERKSGDIEGLCVRTSQRHSHVRLNEYYELPKNIGHAVFYNGLLYGTIHKVLENSKVPKTRLL